VSPSDVWHGLSRTNSTRESVECRAVSGSSEATHGKVSRSREPPIGSALQFQLDLDGQLDHRFELSLEFGVKLRAIGVPP